MLNKFLSGVVVLTYSLLVSTPSVAQQKTGEVDPTKPRAYVNSGQTASTSSQEGRLALEAIFILPQSRSAIINGTRVTEGDTVNNALVKAIEPNKVQIVRQVEGSWTDSVLYLNQQDNIKTIVVEDDQTQ